MKFSQTFEIVRYEGLWKMNRIILCMHDDIIGMLATMTLELTFEVLCTKADGFEIRKIVFLSWLATKLLMRQIKLRP